MISYNTVTDFLRLQFQFRQPVQVKASLYDMTGRKIMNLYDDKTTYQDLHYYLTWLKAGLYLVRVQCGEEVVGRKIVVD